MKDKSFYKNYDVRFAGLGPGRHDYAFDLKTDFLRFYDPDFEDDINIHLDFTLFKTSEVFFELLFAFNGFLNHHCDRCLNNISYPIHSSHKMYLKINNTSGKVQDDEDIIYAGPYDHSFNIADNIHDFILLQFPIKITCDMVGNQCEADMIKKLENLFVKPIDLSSSSDKEDY